MLPVVMPGWTRPSGPGCGHTWTGHGGGLRCPVAVPVLPAGAGAPPAG